MINTDLTPREAYDLAEKYIDGQLDVHRDRVKAEELLLSAAHRGYVPAMYRLGTGYMLGGLRRDDAFAVSWLKKARAESERAAAAGDAEGMWIYGCCLCGGYGGLSIDRVKADELWKGAAKNGCVEAVFELGRRQCNLGHYDKGVPYLEKAAKKGNVPAMRYLADHYLHIMDSHFTVRDLNRGLHWLDKLAGLGDESAASRKRAVESSFYIYTDLAGEDVEGLIERGAVRVGKTKHTKIIIKGSCGSKSNAVGAKNVFCKELDIAELKGKPYEFFNPMDEVRDHESDDEFAVAAVEGDKLSVLCRYRYSGSTVVLVGKSDKPITVSESIAYDTEYTLVMELV